MGWFAIACLLGYGWFSLWRFARAWGIGAKAGLVFAVLLAGLLAVCKWASHARIHTLGQFVDAVGDGSVARFLLGLLLGYCVALVLQQQTGPSGSAPVQDDTTAAAVGAEGSSAKKDDASAAAPLFSGATYLTIGGVVVLLALTAPHVDRWLSRLTTLKTSVIEVQLASISTASKAIVPDVRQQFIDQQILTYVIDFPTSLESDITLLEKVRIANIDYEISKQPRNIEALREQRARYKTQIQQLEAIKKMFVNVVSPLAGCVKMAIDKGLSIESARQALRPLADELVEIITLEEESEKERASTERKIRALKSPDPLAIAAIFSPPETSIRLESVRDKFWTKMTEVPRALAGYRTAADGNKCSVVSPYQMPSPPRVAEYQNLPHLYAAMSYLLLFVNNDGFALTTMQKAQDRNLIEFEDFQVPYIRATFMYFRGDNADRYLPLLEKMKASARAQRKDVETFRERCGTRCSTEEQDFIAQLLKRARHAELLATNNTAYGIAQDIAAGIPSALNRQSIAEENARELEKGAEEKDEADFRDSYLDTISFVTLVTEGRKSNPDRTVLRKVISTLQLLIAHQEQQIAEKSITGKADYTTINDLRAHLDSARALVND